LHDKHNIRGITVTSDNDGRACKLQLEQRWYTYRDKDWPITCCDRPPCRNPASGPGW